MNQFKQLAFSGLSGLLLLCLTSCSSGNQSNKEQSKEPGVVTTQIYFGDPFIMLHDGVYYAYGTASADGIEVYTSTDLLTWEQYPQRKLALDKKDVYW